MQLSINSSKAFKEPNLNDQFAKPIKPFTQSAPKSIKPILLPRAILNQKGRRMMGIFRFDKERLFPEEGIIKKCFGKKITYILHSKQFMQSSLCYKYLKSITLFGEEESQKFYAYCQIKSVRDYVMLDTERVYVREMSTFHRLCYVPKAGSIKLENMNRKFWSALQKRKKAFVNYLDLIVGLNGKSTKKKEDLLNVLEKISKIRILKSLKIIIGYDRFLSLNKSIPKPKNKKRDPKDKQNLCMDALMELINKPEISNIYLRISRSLVAKECPESYYDERSDSKSDILTFFEYLKPILEKIHCLRFHFNQRLDVRNYSEDNQYCFDVQGYEPFESGLIDMSKLPQKWKRILDIYVETNDIEEQFRLLDLLSNCKSLRSLQLKFEGPVNLYSEDELSNEEKEDFKALASKLEEVVLYRNCFSVDNSYFGKILSVMKKERTKLKKLELFYCYSTPSEMFRGSEHAIQKIDFKHYISMEAKGLDKFTSLEELKLTSRGNDFKELRNCLKKLPNLRKLWISFANTKDVKESENYLDYKGENPDQEEDQSIDEDESEGEIEENLDENHQENELVRTNESFPFDQLRKIKELTMRINPEYNNKLWEVDLKNNSEHLQNLEFFEIIYKPERMTIKSLCLIIDLMVSLKNLKIFRLEGNIKNIFIPDELPDSLVKSLKLSIDGEIKRIQSQIENYAVENKSLQEISIGRFEGFGFESIKY